MASKVARKKDGVNVVDNRPARGTWSRQVEFLLSCIGYAVGLGNLWRFPYLCMRNGGGAFLIPYFMFLFLCGIPLFFAELALGQFTSLSPVCVWRLCPLFKGMGWSMLMVAGICCIYYNIIITWVLYYLFMSFTKTLPWATCANWWNTESCMYRSSHNATSSQTSNLTHILKVNSTAQQQDYNHTNGLRSNTSSQSKPVTAGEEFWHNNVLQLSSGIEDLGVIRWELAACLLLAWVIIFACLCKGIKSSGKVVYVTATAPYVFLVILLVRGVTLPGAVNGIIFYLTPQWSRLLEFKVWAEACLQIFYSLGPAWGGLITMASYNKFHNNCYRDAMVIPLVNCFTSFFAGFVIFSVIGFLAHETNLEVEDVITQGPGLVFMTYPDALSRLPISPLWAVLFFIMLLTIGLDSQFGMFETITSSFVDEWPKYLQRHKMLLTAVCCIICLLIGLPLVTQGGMYVFHLMDWYLGPITLLLVSFLECIVLGHFYGADRLLCDVERMIGYKPNVWWKICWKFITPFLLMGAWIFSLLHYSVPTYGDYVYPGWANVIGWILAVSSSIPIPLGMLHQLYKTEGTIIQRLKRSVQPEGEWGPAPEKYHDQYQLDHLKNSLMADVSSHLDSSTLNSTVTNDTANKHSLLHTKSSM